MPEIPAPSTVLLGGLPTAGRLALTQLLEQPGVRVVTVGENPAELITCIRRLQPRLLIVSALQLRALELLSRHAVLPVLLYCEVPPLADMMRKVSRWGVFDFILADATHADWGREVLHKVQTVLPLREPARLAAVPSLVGGLVIIGGSTGSPAAVEQLVPALPATLACPIVVAIHLPPSFLASFVRRLARVAALPVVAGWAGTPLAPGRIVVVPGGRNLLIRPALNSPWQSWQLDFSTESSPAGNDPSVDILMRSAARTVGRNVLGVVLTGLGHDGTLGAQAIRQHGGTVLVQDEASSVVFSMPESVIRAGLATAVLPLKDLPQAIVHHAGQFRRVAPLEARSAQSPIFRAV